MNEDITKLPAANLPEVQPGDIITTDQGETLVATDETIDPSTVYRILKPGTPLWEGACPCCDAYLVAEVDEAGAVSVIAD